MESSGNAGDEEAWLEQRRQQRRMKLQQRVRTDPPEKPGCGLSPDEDPVEELKQAL